MDTELMGVIAFAALGALVLLGISFVLSCFLDLAKFFGRKLMRLL